MKRALVCGASQGIGRATAMQLAKQGYTLTVFSRTQEKLEALCKELPGEDHDFIAADINARETWLPLLQEKQSQKNYSTVILNSGGPKGGPISKAQPEQFIQAMENHLIANSQILNVLLEGMRKQQWGRVVTVTSTSVKIPIPHLGVSNTARAAVASWAKTLSLEVAPYGVTINNVMPGFTETPRLQSLIKAKAEETGKSYAEMEKVWMSTVPMKRFAAPEETASLIGFLCSEEASYITGQNIAVDGGRLGCL